MANLTTSTATTLIRLLLDKAGSPYFTDAEVSLFLELGIKEFINENYKKFELNQATRDNLRTIVKTSTSLTQTNPDEFDISSLSDYRHFLSFEVIIGSEIEYVKIVQLDDYLAIKKDPFNKPSMEKIIK